MRKGLLYQEVNGVQHMKFCQIYTIHCFPPTLSRYYYVGVYLGGFTQDSVIFETVVRVYPGGTKQIRGSKCFSKDLVFKRIVNELEQRKAYRDAFEKRAVNQIVGSIVGHAGAYY